MPYYSLDEFIKKNINEFSFTTKTFNFFKVAGINHIKDLLNLWPHAILTYPKAGTATV